mgnify:CR=1 FL=1
MKTSLNVPEKATFSPFFPRSPLMYIPIHLRAIAQKIIKNAVLSGRYANLAEQIATKTRHLRVVVQAHYKCK